MAIHTVRTNTFAMTASLILEMCCVLQAADIPGTVMTETGSPLAGASVGFYMSQRNTSSDTAKPALSLVNRITSTTNGRLLFAGAPDGQYFVEITASGYQTQWFSPDTNTQFPQSIYSSGPAMMDSLRIVMAREPRYNPPASLVRVSVVDSTGKPVYLIAQAELRRDRDWTSIHKYSADTANVLRFGSLQPGNYFLMVQAENYPTQYYAGDITTTYYETSIPVTAVDTVQIVMRLSQTPLGNQMIVGTALDANRKPLQNVSCQLFRFDNITAPLYSVVSDSRGVFEFQGIIDADYSLKLTGSSTYPPQWHHPDGNTVYPQYKISVHPAMWIDTIRSTLTTTPVNNAPTARLNIEFRDPGGAFVTTVNRVELTRPADGFYTTRYSQGQTQTDTWTFDSLMPGKYAVMAEAQGYPGQNLDTAGNTQYPNDYRITLSSGTATTAAFRFTATPKGNGRIFGIVRDSTAKALSNVTVGLYGSENTNTPYYTAKTSLQGYFSFVDIYERPYYVRFDGSLYPVQWFNQNGPCTKLPQYTVYSGSAMIDTMRATLTLTPAEIVSTGWFTVAVSSDNGQTPTTYQLELHNMATGAKYPGMRQSQNLVVFNRQPAGEYTVAGGGANYPYQYWGPHGNTIGPQASFHLTDTGNSPVTFVFTLNLPHDSTYQPPDTGYNPPDSTWYPGSTGDGALSGIVLNKLTKTPILNAGVIAIRTDQNSWSDFPPTQAESPYKAQTGLDGRFTIDSLPWGTYLVAVKDAGVYFTPQFYENAPRGTEARRLTLDDLNRSIGSIAFNLDVGGAIKGTVIATDGKPVASCEINLESTTGGKFSSARTDTFGVFLAKGIPAGQWVVRVWSPQYFMTTDPWASPVSVTNGKISAAQPIVLTAGGVLAGTYVAGTATVPTGDTSRIEFDVSLFKAALPTDMGMTVYPEHRTNLRSTSPVSFISSTCPAGQWRMVFSPMPRDNYYTTTANSGTTTSTNFVEGYGWTAVAGASSISSSQTVSIAPFDTVGGIQVPLRKGYTLFGSVVTEQDPTSPYPGSYWISVFVKDGDRYYSVTEGRKTEPGRFSIPGLIDGEEYFIGIGADGYPFQYWSADRSTGWPKDMYAFSTTQFRPLAIVLNQSPEGGDQGPDGGSTGGPVSLWLETRNGLPVIKWRIDPSLRDKEGIFSVDLYQRSYTGLVTKKASVAVTADAADYSWQQTAPCDNCAYTIVARGASALIRPMPVHAYEMMSGPLSADSLRLTIRPSRWGIEFSWSADTAYRAAPDDKVVLYRLTGSSWTPIASRSGYENWFKDETFDPQRDANAVLKYRAELTAAGFKRSSPVVTFTVNAEFIGQLMRNLSVGPYETYKTIQSAIDAARDGDGISVAPGTYRENPNLRGKFLDIHGEWRYGEPPVIDAAGKTGFLVPFTTRAAGWDRVNISGFKIMNAAIGVRTSAGTQISQCLFVNSEKAVEAYIDSAMMVLAMNTNPFILNRVEASAWQCTFIGRTPAATCFIGAARGLAESPAFTEPADWSTEMYIKPAKTLYPQFHLSNSIVYNYTNPAGPFAVTGKFASVGVGNSDLWNTVMPASTGPVRIEPSVFKRDPQFVDTVYYFLPEGSDLAAMSSNKEWIGYDRNRYDDGGSGSDGPRPQAVTGFTAAQVGMKAVLCTWSPNPQADDVTRYLVYRVAGDPNLFYASPSGQWEPTFNEDNMHLYLDTFSTTDTWFIDTTVIPDSGYLYGVAAVNSLGRTGSMMPLPSSQPLSAWIVNKHPWSIMLQKEKWHLFAMWGRDAAQLKNSASLTVYRWDPSATADKLYSQYVRSDSLRPTEACWVYSIKDTLLQVARSSGSKLVTDRSPFTIRLDAGWNLVSSPYPFTLPKPAGLSFDLWQWDPIAMSYRLAREIRPFTGYWVYADTLTTILLREPPLNPASFTQPLAKMNTAGGWEMRISLAGADGADPDNFVGVMPGLGKSAVSVSPEPPAPFDHSHLYIRGTLPDGSACQAAKSYLRAQAERMEWEIGITASSRKATVTFDRVGDVPQRFSVFWVTRDGAVDLRKQTAVEITEHEDNVYGYLIVTSDPAELALYTGTFVFRNNYPNPFNRTTTLEFVVPYGWNADGSRMAGEYRDLALRVHNLNGQTVRDLVSGKTKVGFYRIVWDGRGNNGNNLPAGMYLAHMHSGDFNKTVRMFKVR